MTEKQYNDRIQYIFDEIKKIKNEIEKEEDSVESIIDSYEIDRDCYDFIDSKDEFYFKLFIELVKAYYKEEQFKLDNVIIRLKDYDKKNKEYQSFLNFIKDGFNILQINKLNKIKNNNSDDSDSDSEAQAYNDDNLDELDTIKQKDIIENKFKLRDNQTLARENNKKNNFCSGIHNQVTGAGKSLLMMLTIYDHYLLNKNNNLYIITCPRIEVLNKMFFEENDSGEYIICDKNKQFWKNNNIIDLDKFKIIDRVNYKSESKLKLSKTKPNI